MPGRQPVSAVTADLLKRSQGLLSRRAEGRLPGPEVGPDQLLYGPG